MPGFAIALNGQPIDQSFDHKIEAIACNLNLRTKSVFSPQVYTT
jgi:hypothetical protein